MDTTKHIEDLILSDFEADAIRLATVGGPSALASFVLDYIRVAVDWRSLANNLSLRSNASGEADLQTRGLEIDQELKNPLGPETG